MSVTRAIERNKAIPRQHYCLTIVLKENGQIIGDLLIRLDDKRDNCVADIDYTLDPAFWGQGLMTETLIAATKFCHDTLKLHRIKLRCDAANTGSWKVMEKAGYIREGVESFSTFTLDSWRESTYRYASVRPDLVRKYDE